MVGSKKAEIQRWELNLQSHTAVMSIAGRRMLYPPERPLDLEPIVRKVVDAVLANREVPFLTRGADGCVAVEIGHLIPGTGLVRQTVEGRRKRFRTALTASLAESGWMEVQPNFYLPDPAPPAAG